MTSFNSCIKKTFVLSMKMLIYPLPPPQYYLFRGWYHSFQDKISFFYTDVYLANNHHVQYCMSGTMGGPGHETIIRKRELSASMELAFCSNTLALWTVTGRPPGTISWMGGGVGFGGQFWKAADRGGSDQSITTVAVLVVCVIRSRGEVCMPLASLLASW